MAGPGRRGSEPRRQYFGDSQGAGSLARRCRMDRDRAAPGLPVQSARPDRRRGDADLRHAGRCRDARAAQGAVARRGEAHGRAANLDRALRAGACARGVAGLAYVRPRYAVRGGGGAAFCDRHACECAPCRRHRRGGDQRADARRGLACRSARVDVPLPGCRPVGSRPPTRRSSRRHGNARAQRRTLELAGRAGRCWARGAGLGFALRDRACRVA